VDVLGLVEPQADSLPARLCCTPAVVTTFFEDRIEGMARVFGRQLHGNEFCQWQPLQVSVGVFNRSRLADDLFTQHGGLDAGESRVETPHLESKMRGRLECAYGFRPLLVAKEVEDACDQVRGGVIDHGVAVVIAHCIARRNRWKIAENIRRNGLKVCHVLSREVPADQEMMTPGTVQAGHVRIEIAAEAETIPAVSPAVVGTGWRTVIGNRPSRIRPAGLWTGRLRAIGLGPIGLWAVWRWFISALWRTADLTATRSSRLAATRLATGTLSWRWPVVSLLRSAIILGTILRVGGGGEGRALDICRQQGRCQ
jgi:hypothetical protein